MAPNIPVPSVKHAAVTIGKGFNPRTLLQQLVREALPYGIEARRVQSLFEAELATLQATAKIQDFVPVLVSRKVRAAFKHLGTLPTAASSSTK